MSDDEMLALESQPQWQRVRVTASDYGYEGWLVTVFRKRRTQTQYRCVVEDDNGRLFIHNAGQLSVVR